MLLRLAICSDSEYDEDMATVPVITVGKSSFDSRILFICSMVRFEAVIGYSNHLHNPIEDARASQRAPTFRSTAELTVAWRSAPPPRRWRTPTTSSGEKQKVEGDEDQAAAAERDYRFHGVEVRPAGGVDLDHLTVDHRRAAAQHVGGPLTMGNISSTSQADCG